MDAGELALASLIRDTSGPGELPVSHQRRTKVNKPSGPGVCYRTALSLCLAAVEHDTRECECG